MNYSYVSYVSYDFSSYNKGATNDDYIETNKVIYNNSYDFYDDIIKNSELSEINAKISETKIYDGLDIGYIDNCIEKYVDDTAYNKKYAYVRVEFPKLYDRLYNKEDIEEVNKRLIDKNVLHDTEL